MTLHPTEERLNDYVDGYLSPGEAREVEHHLERCGACREEVASIRTLLREVDTLPAEIAPPPDLWVGIREETVELPARRRETLWGMRHGLAAAAVVLVALSSTLTLWVARERAPASLPAVTAQRTPSTPVAAPAALVAFREAEAEYVRTVADLEAVLRARGEQLSPQTVRVVEQNLRIIDGAIREARAALEADPGSAELPILLSSIYREKISVLERAVRLSTRT